MKAEVDKQGINKLISVPTSSNNLKTKIDDLGVGQQKAVPVHLKNSSDTESKEVVKNTKFSTLNIKVNNLEN